MPSLFERYNVGNSKKKAAALEATQIAATAAAVMPKMQDVNCEHNQQQQQQQQLFQQQYHPQIDTRNNPTQTLMTKSRVERLESIPTSTVICGKKYTIDYQSYNMTWGQANEYIAKSTGTPYLRMSSPTNPHLPPHLRPYLYPRQSVYYGVPSSSPVPLPRQQHQEAPYPHPQPQPRRILPQQLCHRSTSSASQSYYHHKQQQQLQPKQLMQQQQIQQQQQQTQPYQQHLCQQVMNNVNRRQQQQHQQDWTESSDDYNDDDNEDEDDNEDSVMSTNHSSDTDRDGSINDAEKEKKNHDDEDRKRNNYNNDALDVPPPPVSPPPNGTRLLLPRPPRSSTSPPAAKKAQKSGSPRPSGKWQAQLYVEGKSRYIGVFESREKAALAYEITREQLKSEKSKDGGVLSPTKTEAAVSAARKAAFEGVNERDHVPAHHSTTIDPQHYPQDHRLRNSLAAMSTPPTKVGGGGGDGGAGDATAATTMNSTTVPHPQQQQQVTTAAATLASAQGYDTVIAALAQQQQRYDTMIATLAQYEPPQNFHGTADQSTHHGGTDAAGDGKGEIDTTTNRNNRRDRDDPPTNPVVPEQLKRASTQTGWEGSATAADVRNLRVTIRAEEAAEEHDGGTRTTKETAPKPTTRTTTFLQVSGPVVAVESNSSATTIKTTPATTTIVITTTLVVTTGNNSNNNHHSKIVSINRHNHKPADKDEEAKRGEGALTEARAAATTQLTAEAAEIAKVKELKNPTPAQLRKAFKSLPTSIWVYVDAGNVKNAFHLASIVDPIVLEQLQNQVRMYGKYKLKNLRAGIKKIKVKWEASSSVVTVSRKSISPVMDESCSDSEDMNENDRPKRRQSAMTTTDTLGRAKKARRYPKRSSIVLQRSLSQAVLDSSSSLSTSKQLASKPSQPNLAVVNQSVLVENTKKIRCGECRSCQHPRWKHRCYNERIVALASKPSQTIAGVANQSVLAEVENIEKRRCGECCSCQNLHWRHRCTNEGIVVLLSCSSNFFRRLLQPKSSHLNASSFDIVSNATVAKSVIATSPTEPAVVVASSSNRFKPLATTTTEEKEVDGIDDDDDDDDDKFIII